MMTIITGRLKRSSGFSNTRTRSSRSFVPIKEKRIVKRSYLYTITAQVKEMGKTSKSASKGGLKKPNCNPPRLKLTNSKTNKRVLFRNFSLKKPGQKERMVKPKKAVRRIFSMITDMPWVGF